LLQTEERTLIWIGKLLFGPAPVPFILYVGGLGQSEGQGTSN